MVHPSLITICLILIVARSFNGTQTTSSREFDLYKYVVTRFKELPNFYEKLRSQNPQAKSDLDFLDRSSICRKIFGRNNVIEPDYPEYTTTLNRDFPTIYDELFIKNGTERRGILAKFKFIRSTSKMTDSYDNSSRFRSFRVNGREREEMTFACVTQNVDGTHFKMYFVSDYAYNINEVPNVEIYHGRFIFFGDQIHALAEEPLGFFYQNNWDMLVAEYRAKKNGFAIAEKWENDPICKLELEKKFRLCTHICAQFSDHCGEKEIIVDEPCRIKGFWLENELYYEWMLTCKTPGVVVYAQEFSIARAYTDNEAFVFRFTSSQVFRLFVHLARISFLTDPKAGGGLEKTEN